MKLNKKSPLFWTNLRVLGYRIYIYSLCSSLLIFSDPALAKIDYNGLIGGLIQGFQQNQQQQQQQAMMQQQMAMQQQVQAQAMAKHNAEMQAHGQLLNSLMPQAQPARYFNNCTLPHSKSSFPRGACEIPRTARNEDRDIIPVDFTAYQKALSFKALANNYVSFYEQLMSTAQNSASPVGVQCLEESKEKTKTNIIDRINYLRSVIGEMNKNNQNFRDNSVQYVEAIKKHNTMLDGRGDLTKHDVSGKFKEFFGNGACLDVLKSAELSGIGGLKALRDGVASREKVASQYSSSASKYRSEVEAIVQEAQKDLKNRGLEAWLADPNSSAGFMTKSGQLSRFGALTGALSYEKQKLDGKLAKIKKELADVPSANVKMPALDLSFKDNIKKLSEARMIGGFMRQCMLKPSQFDIGSTKSLEDTIDSVRMLITNEQGTTKPTYIKRAKEIIRKYKLRGEDNTEWLIQEIAKLDKEYAGLIGVIRSNVSNGRKEPITVSAYLQGLNDACKQTLSNTSSNPNALSSQISEATKALKELEQIHDGFSIGAMQTIRDWVLNCNGREYKPNGSSCTEATFELSQPSFCIKHAETCAGNTLSCDKKIKDKITEHQSARANTADAYNKNVEQFVTVHNAEVQRLKDRVIADMEFMKRYFPGANYTFPENFFVAMPEPIDTPYGVMLRGGTNLQKTLDGVSAQVEKLVVAMEDQLEQVVGAIDNYIAEQTKAMDANHKRWEKLLNECTDYEKNYIDSEIARANAERKRIADQQAEMQKQQEEMKKKQDEVELDFKNEADDFCTRFGQFQSNAKFDNPGPACDMAETLFKDANEVSKVVTEEAIAAVNEFHNYCQTIQSEGRRRDRDSEDEEYDSPRIVKVPEIKEYCKEDTDGSGAEEIFNKVKRQFEENRLPKIDLSEEDFLNAISKQERFKELDRAGELDQADLDALDTLLRLNPNSDLASTSRDPGHLKGSVARLEEKLTKLNEELKKATAKSKPDLEGKIAELDKFIKYVKAEHPSVESSVVGTNLCIIEQEEIMAKAIEACVSDDKISSSCLESKVDEVKTPKDIEATILKTQKGIAALYQNSRTIASKNEKVKASTKLVRLGEKVDDVRCAYVSPNSRQSSGNGFLDNIFSPDAGDTKNLQRILDETR
jgi:hypothetical protein